jgi:hypothetical protein
MAKPRKKASAPEAPVAPQVGDKVRPGRSEMVYEISHVSHDGGEVNLHVPGTAATLESRELVQHKSAICVRRCVC